MNNDILSNKRVFLMATMLSSMLLAASLMTSLVPTQALALEVNTDVADEVIRQQLNPNSESGEEQDASNGDAEAQAEEPETTSADEEQDASNGNAEAEESTASPLDSGINLDSNSEEDTSRVEEDDNVNVDPVIQSSVQPDVNVNVDTAVVMDEEDCEDANNEVVQANGQESDQQTGSEGRVGDNGMYVSPKLQLSEQVAVNANVDTDVVLVEGCNPVDDITQVNAQQQDQGLDNDLSSSPSGTVIIPAHQRADNFAYNFGVNKDVELPVL